MGFARKLARAKKKAGAAGAAAAVPAPPQFHQRVENLRTATLESTDLAVPFNYFHDELAAAPGFNMEGVALKNPKLRKVVEKAIQRVVPTCQYGRLLLLHFGDFWHGLFDTSAGPVVLYYFEQQDVGLAGFVSGAERTELIRFTVVETHGGVPVGGGAVGQA